MGIFDQQGNRFIRENIGSDNKPSQIVFITPSSDINNTTTPSESNSIGIFSGDIPSINPTSMMSLNLGSTTAGYLQRDFNFYYYLSKQMKINFFTNYFSSLFGYSLMTGTPDLRIGVTAADASPITIFSSTASGTRYEVKARILATAGTSATYKIVWTEGGVAQPVSLTITAVDTEVHDNFVIAPDAGTNITAQITSLTSSTVNVDAIVSVLG